MVAVRSTLDWTVVADEKWCSCRSRLGFGRVCQLVWGDGSRPLESRGNGLVEGQVAQKLVIFCIIYYNNVTWKKAEQYLVFSERELTFTFATC